MILRLFFLMVFILMPVYGHAAGEIQGNRGYIAGTPPAETLVPATEEDPLPTLREVIHSIDVAESVDVVFRRVDELDQWIKTNMW